MPERPPPEFEIIGEISDQAIDALAALLISLVEQEELECEEVKH